ncbi:MAG: hypothetical protein R3D55_01270 [Chloroflexota bacterium]
MPEEELLTATARSEAKNCNYSARRLKEKPQELAMLRHAKPAEENVGCNARR